MKTKREKMTVAQVVFMAARADKLFEQAARAWVRGDGSGNSKAYHKGLNKCERLRTEAEALLAPLGIETDYPGLYPSFKVNGRHEYSVINAISAALGEI